LPRISREERLVQVRDKLAKMLERELAKQVFLPSEIEKYRQDIPLFCQEVLDETCSEDQANFLKLMSDLEVKDVIVAGARGTGKSRTAAKLAIWSSVFLTEEFGGGYLVTILGGNYDQAKITFSHIRELMSRDERLYSLIERRLRDRLVLVNGSEIRVHKASTAHVRGLHPDLLIIDEAAEADKREGSEVLSAALDSISAAKHGRRVMLTTPHYLGGVFGTYWNNAEKLGFKRLRWTAEPGKRPWIDEGKQIVEFERAKQTSPSFSVEWLALPHEESRLLHLSELVDGAVASFDKANHDEYWIGCDFGYYPHKTVVLVFAKRNDQILVVEAHERLKASCEEVSQLVFRLAEEFGTREVYGDSTGRLYLDRMNELGLNAKAIVFQKEKERLIQKLDLLLSKGGIKFNSEIKDLVRQTKFAHRDDRGRIAKGDDDYYDALLAGLAKLDTGSSLVLVPLSVEL